LLCFLGVLADIPGQPRGIFVNENGFQKGALEVAKAHGIAAYEIREIVRDAKRPPIEITAFSTIELGLRPDRLMV
jgi:hypothetical protein